MCVALLRVVFSALGLKNAAAHGARGIINTLIKRLKSYHTLFLALSCQEYASVAPARRPHEWMRNGVRAIHGPSAGELDA